VYECVLAAEETKKPLIVLSHHAPLTMNTSNPAYEGDPLSCTHSTDLSALMKPCVKLWAFGHTHWRTDYMFRGVRIYSNPRGYGNSKEPYPVDFSKTATVRENYKIILTLGGFVRITKLS
jgi:hypothetical protein